MSLDSVHVHNYLNKLIEVLRNSNFWCRYSSQYMGVYCSVDDLSLLSPTYTGLQEFVFNFLKIW